MRQRAMAQLRSVSIPEIVRDMAGSDPVRKIADFDRHYMPDGQQAPEASSRGTSDAHRAELKTNATGFRRSLSEVFADCSRAINDQVLKKVVIPLKIVAVFEPSEKVVGPLKKVVIPLKKK